MKKSYVALGLIVAVCAIVVVGVYLPSSTNSTSNHSVVELFSPANVPQSVNNFAIGVYSKLANESGNETSNLIFSPFSLSAALSMTAVGAGGNTRTELDNVLGLSDNSTKNNMGFGRILNSILPKNASYYNLSVSDGIWVEQTFPIKQTFVDTLSTYYGAVAREADFINNADATRTDINDWVANKTNNKILDLIPQGAVDSSTRVVLVNAVHFKANWTSTFDPDATSQAPFFVSPTENVTVQMMHQEGKMQYYSDSQLKAIELDYSRSNITMLILLPNQDNGLSAVESGLSSKRISNIEAGLTKQEVDVSLPKFNITSPSMPLEGTLMSLGIRSAFSPTANFSGISQTTNLSISGVYQKAFIKVNEQGTEAAAATAVVIVATAIEQPTQPQEFNANHPFLFFIIDKTTGTILFMGREANPTISS